MMPNARQLAGLVLLTAAAIVIAGCRTGGGASPAPSPAAPGEIRSKLTPKETVESFRDVLRGEMVNTALFMIDDIDYGSQAAELTRTRIKKLSEDMVADRYDFVPLEQKIDEDCAAVIVRETSAGKGELTAIYLIFRNNRWHISPEVWSYERILGLDSSHQSRFRVLQKWYQIRRGELRAQE